MKIIVNGACGRMGKELISAAKSNNIEIAACVDVCSCANGDLPFYRNLASVDVKADVLIDFSNHVSINDISAFVASNPLPCVIASTGHTESELALMRAMAESVPVFYSRNMSLGINVLIDLCRCAVKAFGGECDIEIIEKHHRNKLDSPSGTALMIAEELLPLLPEGASYVTDRSDRRAVRPANEIGISSVRCGAIFGEHEVIISHGAEYLTLKHTAGSRALFAEGALSAADYVMAKAPGMYSMKDLLSEKSAPQN